MSEARDIMSASASAPALRTASWTPPDGHRLVGMVAVADVARALPDPQVGDLLAALSTD